MNRTKKRKIRRYIILAIPILIVLVFFGSKYIQSMNYKAAMNFMEEKEYGKAILLFKEIGSYKDSNELSQQCEIMPDYDSAVALMDAMDYKNAKSAFLELGDFKDSKEMALQCDDKAYQYAKTLFDKGDYDLARAKFAELGDYLDSKEQIVLCGNMLLYHQADDYLKAWNYSSASDLYKLLGDFKDSKQLLEECNAHVYQKALDLMDANEFDQAKDMFSELGSYQDSSELAVKCEETKLASLYEAAMASYEEENYYTAYQKFMELGDYSDSAEKAEDCIRPYPSSKVLYKNKNFKFNFAPLCINTEEGDPTYLKIYSTDESLVATMFINSGESLSIDMPKGSFTINEANGSVWYGENEKFGEEGSYCTLDTVLEFENRGEGYSILLYSVVGGNLGSSPTSMNGF